MSLPSVRVEVAFAAGFSTPAASRGWTDITGYVEGGLPLSITRGRADEVSQIPPSRMTLTLNNRDGSFTPGRVASAFYPYVKKGRPIRASVALVANTTFEVDVSGYTGSNATLARSTAQAHTGAASMSVTAVAAAGMLVVDSGSGTGGIPVKGGATYPVSAWARAATTGRSVLLKMDWWDAAGAFISTTSGTVVADTTTGWTYLSESFVAPSNAAFARRQFAVVSPAAGEVHYLDDFRFDLVRFTGYVDEWHPTWPDSTDAYSTCELVCSSRTARLGRAAELRSIREERIRAASPTMYYTFGEPSGATSANDTSGNQHLPLTIVDSVTGTGAAPTFGTAIGLDAGAQFHGDGVGGGKYLVGQTSEATPGGVLLVFSRSLAAWGSNEYVLTAPDNVVATINPSLYMSNALLVLSASGITLSVAGNPATQDGLVHILEIVEAPAGTLTMWLDGANVATTAGSMPFRGRLTVGGSPIGGGTFSGTLAHLATYATAPTTAEIADRAAAFKTGFAGELSGARIIRYAGYGGIPSAEISADTGQATIGAFEITGQTPISLMQKVTETENGVLYDARDGTLVFKERDTRYTLASSFTLSVTAQEVEADLEPKDDDQFLVNDVTVSANGTTAGRVYDQTSIDANNYYRKSLDTVTDSVDDAIAGAQWAVATGKDPDPRYTSVTVDVTNSSDAQAAAVLAADIGTRFTLSTLPSQAPASSVGMFIEGSSETITATGHVITFNTSPAAPYDVWTIEDAVFGQYDAYPISF